MAAIGTGWVDGAWVQAAWVTTGDGAWVQTDPEETGDGKLGLLSAGLYSPTGNIVTLGKIGKP